MCDTSRPWIDINLMSLIGADFACACVLISFGVIIGTASPLMLIVMTMIEVVLFNVNEVIGRQYFGTRDAGDTIFVHMFGAYFGLAVARVIWDQKIEDSQNKGEDKYSNLFSMVKRYLKCSTVTLRRCSLQRSGQFSCGFTGQASTGAQRPLVTLR